VTALSQNRLARASLVGSFDRAVSSGSLAFAADAVCYGNSIVHLLFDRFTTAWERDRRGKQHVTIVPLCSSKEGSTHKKMPDCQHAKRPPGERLT
jgi:hypothetical protein